MSIFERYLSLWVALCIVAGVLLGQAFPAAFQAIGQLEVAQVNLPVGLLIWVMITEVTQSPLTPEVPERQRGWR